MSANETTILPRSDDRWKFSLLIAIALFGTTVALFSSAWNNDFVAWDDHVYVYKEPLVLDGIRLSGLAWALSASVSNNWHPLTLISLQLDAQLFGPKPLGFHRTSVLIHAINAALAFYTLMLLTGCRWRSAITAALFAIHPLRVESVAWVSERKDVLSGFFFFLTLIAYVRYVRTSSVGRYLVVAFCLAMGLCAKSMLVTTPCVLLLLDYWPLRRRPDSAAGELRRFFSLLFEKIPLLGLSAIVSLVTIACQKSVMSHLTNLPLKVRLENAVRGSVAYLGQTFWPIGLSHFYPIPETSLAQCTFAASVLIAVTLVAVWQRNQRPYLLFGWLWFVGILVPVSGLVQVGLQQRADRYTYLAQIGLLLAVVWCVADIVRSSKRATIVSVALLGLSLAGFGQITVNQIQVWKSTKSLWTHAYQMDHQNRMAMIYLMPVLFQEGQRNEALRLANSAIAIEDRYNRELLLLLSEILSEHGEFETSILALDKAIEYQFDTHVDDIQLYLGRGEALAALGRWDEAIKDYRRATELSPEVVPFQFGLAHALGKAGQIADSNRVYADALRRLPQWPERAAQIAMTICTTQNAPRNRRFRAVVLAEEANTITQGKQLKILETLAVNYFENGQFEQSVTTMEQAIQLAESQKQTKYAAILHSRLKSLKHKLHSSEMP